MDKSRDGLLRYHYATSPASGTMTGPPAGLGFGSETEAPATPGSSDVLRERRQIVLTKPGVDDGQAVGANASPIDEIIGLLIELARVANAGPEDIFQDGGI